MKDYAEAIFAAILLSCAPMIFVFGTDAIVLILYEVMGLFVSKETLWEIMPPERVNLDPLATDVVTFIVLIIGLFLAAGIVHTTKAKYLLFAMIVAGWGLVAWLIFNTHTRVIF